MSYRSLALATLALAALDAPLAAQDLSGTWEITSETPRGAQTMTLSISQEGMDLTGTVTVAGGPRGGGGGGGGGGRTLEISDGMIHGSEFNFSLTMSFGDNSFTQTYSGTVSGEVMKGIIAGGPRGGDRPFTGRRAG